MKLNYTTNRLLLQTLTETDAAFILELVNTAGWIRFIGDRNIKNIDDAVNYIRKILSNPSITYWVVTLKETDVPVGLVTFIKRDYLDHPDIGFAFLPAYNNQGLAFEATKEVLNDLLNSGKYPTILATTIPDNIASINLLQKLGLFFSREITYEGLALKLFCINATNKITGNQ